MGVIYRWIGFILRKGLNLVILDAVLHFLRPILPSHALDETYPPENISAICNEGNQR